MVYEKFFEKAMEISTLKGRLMLISEWYLIEKYGFRYECKPPIGYCQYSNTSMIDKFFYHAKYLIWSIDCRLDKFSGDRRKRKFRDRIKKRVLGLQGVFIGLQLAMADAWRASQKMEVRMESLRKSKLGKKMQDQ